MNRTWLVIDVSGLAYRSLYTMGDLSFGGEGTGAIYGVLRTVTDLMELFNTDRVAWCFDGGCSARRKVREDYKEHRRAEPKNAFEEEAQQSRIEVRVQLDRLRTKVLPDAGFRNIFWQSGYEADDLIASICLNLPYEDDKVIIVTTDDDLLQLLDGETVRIWNLNKKAIVTSDSFTREHHLDPKDWAKVKAIAGCPGDGVEGVRGVGVKKAIDYLNLRMKKDSKAYQDIKANWERIKENLTLVKLPFQGTERLTLEEEMLTKKKWESVMDSLGIRSLRDRMPRRRMV